MRHLWFPQLSPNAQRHHPSVATNQPFRIVDLWDLHSIWFIKTHPSYHTRAVPQCLVTADFLREEQRKTPADLSINCLKILSVSSIADFEFKSWKFPLLHPHIQLSYWRIFLVSHTTVLLHVLADYGGLWLPDPPLSALHRAGSTDQTNALFKPGTPRGSQLSPDRNQQPRNDIFKELKEKAS